MIYGSISVQFIETSWAIIPRNFDETASVFTEKITESSVHIQIRFLVRMVTSNLAHVKGWNYGIMNATVVKMFNSSNHDMV